MDNKDIAGTFALNKIMRAISNQQACQEVTQKWSEGHANKPIDISTFNEILHFLTTSYSEKSIGVNLGSQLTLGDYGLLGSLMLHSSNVKEALNYLSHYFDAVWHWGCPIKLSAKNDFLIVQVDPSIIVKNITPIAISYTISAFIGLMRQICGADILPEKVFLQESNQPLEAFFQSLNIVFDTNSKQNYIVYPKLLLDQKLPGDHLKLRNLAKEELDVLLKSRQEENSILDKIIAILDEQPNLKDANLNEVANQLHVSSSTLNRQLKQINTSFRDVLTAYRHKRSVRWLAEDRDIVEITDQLGFSDRSAFERAFKTWTGMTPAQFKSTNQSIVGMANEGDPLATEKLPLMSPVGMEITQLINQDDYNIEDLTEVVERDPILTAKIIGLANSAFYGAFNISSVEQAVVQVFGVDMVRNLALAIMSNNAFPMVPFQQYNIVDLWVDSFTIAELSSNIYRKAKLDAGLTAQEVYLSGLLINVGFLYLIYSQREKMIEVLEQSDLENYSVENIAELERKILGVDHYQASAVLLTHWGLPNRLIKVIQKMTNINEKENGWQISKLFNIVDGHSIKMNQLQDFSEEGILLLSEHLDVDTEVVLDCFNDFLEKYEDLKTMANSMFEAQ